MKSDAVFEEIRARVTSDATIAAKAKGLYHWTIKDGSGATKDWTIDLTASKPTVTEGKPTGKADLVITVSDDDMIAMANGSLNSQQAFMQGKLKVQGNMGLAMKLGPIMTSAKKAKL
jgi:3-hydroxyacyl-CoA dehydrogenase/3a,7a,12a-trihydroxy-5b-cholest-24-enoyl-CoA hydratase